MKASTYKNIPYLMHTEGLFYPSPETTAATIDQGEHDPGDRISDRFDRVITVDGKPHSIQVGERNIVLPACLEHVEGHSFDPDNLALVSAALRYLSDQSFFVTPTPYMLSHFYAALCDASRIRGSQNASCCK